MGGLHGHFGDLLYPYIFLLCLVFHCTEMKRTLSYKFLLKDASQFYIFYHVITNQHERNTLTITPGYVSSPFIPFHLIPTVAF